jgi:hypothetical protein
MGIEATRRLPKALSTTDLRGTVVKGTWSINECQGKRDIEWAKGIHSVWACYVFSQVLNVTSSRILSRFLFVTFTEQNATMDDPFLVLHHVVVFWASAQFLIYKSLPRLLLTSENLHDVDLCIPQHSSTKHQSCDQGTLTWQPARLSRKPAKSLVRLDCQFPSNPWGCDPRWSEWGCYGTWMTNAVRLNGT